MSGIWAALDRQGVQRGNFIHTMPITTTMPSQPDLPSLPSGTMLAGPLWGKPVRLLAAKSRDGVMFLTLDGMGTKMYDPDQLDGVHIVKHTYGIPWKAHAYVSILRHERARNLGIAGNADPLPHQLESIYHITGIPGPIRFLLADEPGAGKTAVASRIIQELVLQRRVRNVLVVVPAQLKTQWKSELAKFANISSHIVAGKVSGNPWITDDGVLVTSMDFAKSEHHRTMFEQARFDLVVVDEAHNLNATAKKSTARYNLGKTLSKISKHLIFLTATPHRGKTENFRLLLKLLEPAEFSDPKMEDGEIATKKRRLFLRHIKEEMRGMDDEPLFKGRSVVSLTYKMSDAERRMYKAVTAYVRRQFAASEMLANKVAGFAILLIQKRMASSTHSLLKTLQRRRTKIAERRDNQDTDYDFDDIYDLSDSDKMAKEEALEGFTASRTEDELGAELAELDMLIGAAKIAAETKPDTKLESLLGELRSLGGDQLLIFSEYRDTLDYLEENIHKAGLAGGGICRIDGTMGMDVRQQAQDDFNSGRKHIMLATDAAREGINLQYRCHRMVNYDLPWSPIALEQRMGRLHRYGQKRNVKIRNLVASEMMEGKVLDRLFTKLEDIGKQYKTFDVMGTVLVDINMGGMLKEVVRAGAVDVEGNVEEAARRAANADQMLARTPVDIEFVRSRMRKIEMQKTDGEHLVNAIGRMFSEMGGSVGASRDGSGTVLSVPGNLVGGPLDRRRVALPGPPAKELARGGAAYRHISDWVLHNCADDLRNGSVFVDDSGRDGWVVFHEVRVTDGNSNAAAELLLVHYTDGASVTEVEPHILDGMSYGEAEPDSGYDGDALVGHVFRAAQREMDELMAGRRAFWKIRSEVGRRGLEMRIREIEVRQGGMSVMDPEHGRLDDERLELANKLKALDGEAERETRLSLDEPRLVGWVRVIPGGRTKTDTEMLGMRACMDDERRNGFEPEDVHKKRGIGYDILSKHPDGRVRKIEVKARCDMSGLEFTDAEKQHLETDPNAVLYVLWNAGHDDEKHVVYDDPSKLVFLAQKGWRVNVSGLGF